MLSGAGVIDYTANNKAVHMTFDGIVKSANAIEVTSEDLGDYTPVNTSSTDYSTLHTYVMVMDNGQVIDYLGDGEITQQTTVTPSNGWTITPASGMQFNADLIGKACLVDCYATTSATVQTLTIDMEHFGGTFYIEAETLFRDEGTGKDFPATFIIPKGKIQGNFTFSMAATGDPSTFDFTIDCTVGQLRTVSGTKGKVLYAIDIIDTISTDSHHDSTGNIDVPGEGNTWSNLSGVTGAIGSTGATGTTGA